MARHLSAQRFQGCYQFAERPVCRARASVSEGASWKVAMIRQAGRFTIARDAAKLATSK